ncbi:multidrug efflux RND transporter permease subunit [Paucibacter sp. B2R-40]|uniref:multidrug efflux RND transporter permease subunit n=1 Tax=Paucibacter sp. B2R-40 TaxID=2893554 RepID=UPI0021E3AA5E|nr:multidrug efflux RND transporter permease subunit [Paucibacter sp. B2R-40]MCV2355844.1 multidrug efflux RND transporter permease subunit [Paucibacter sp. B2R-40]
MGFFVKRPVMATVIALLFMLIGILASTQLAVEQYPNVAPPQVQITAVYPGASPETLETTVAAPLEREMNGIDGLLYMQSTSSASGSMQLQIFFQPGTDLDLAAVEVNNRAKRVESLLPQEVLRNGLRVDKTNPQILQVIVMQSDDPRFDRTYIANLANSQVINELKRLPGAGDVTLFAAPYAMRLWLDPDRLSKYRLTSADVGNAVREQNQNFAVGEIGQSPADNGQTLTFPVQTAGGLTDVEQFKNIVIRAQADGSVVRVRDIARVELGADDYLFESRLNGKPAVAIGVYLRPGGNALELSKALRVKMDQLTASFPREIKWSISYDTTKFVTASVELVVHTFIEAFILVLVVVYLFLGSMRATIIPLLAIPVSIVGTMAGLLLAGFSINMLTLFGLVLAIGIVVDDAIVVVEAVEKIMHDEHLDATSAAIKAMQGIGGAIVGVTAVICAVFVPIAFLGGVTGTLYKQFAITITFATLLSAITALTLTPALCALILKPGMTKLKPIQMFDRFFERVTGGYVAGVKLLLARKLLAWGLYGGMIAGVVFLFGAIPGGFVPEEDKGSIYVAVDLPAGASPERTREALIKAEKILASEDSVKDATAILGFSIFYRYANQAFVFITLKPWAERNTPETHVNGLIKRLNMKFSTITEARVFALNEPPISGMGNVAGFDMRLISLDGDRAKLNAATMALVGAAAKDERLIGTRSVAAPDVQTLFLDVDRNKAKSLGVSVPDLYATVGTLMGSNFINQFTAFGTNLKVKMQAEQAYRSDPAALERFQLRNTAGELVPLAALMRTEWRSAPIALTRYNGYPSIQINGGPAPGRSSGEALDAMEELAAAHLPDGVTFEWSGQSLQERLGGSQASGIFALSLIFVFLFLAALYESWSLPVAVFLIVPIAILGALLALLLRGSPNDVFFQVSLITLVGLAGKNGILIVEFAKQQYEAGKSVMEAAIEAGRQRLRPIVMTSLAFILGVLPLVKASGAGAATQHSVGTGILGGMLAATLVGVFFTPLFYVAMMSLFKPKTHPLTQTQTPTKTPTTPEVTP